MRVFASDEHRRHAPEFELSGGRLVPPFECPERVEIIRARLAERGFSDVVAPGPVDMGPVRAMCDPGYLAFLETGWDRWRAAGFAGDIMAAGWPARRMHDDRPPRDIDGLAGYYALAAETAICAGTWAAAQSSAASAMEAAECVAAGGAAFALCRPPGHHATADMYGGYCFLNNAALAAERLRAAGAAKVAVLDVDFHHGNGTQDVFWERGDVFFASIHGDPLEAFPHFLGFADEVGVGAGEGATLNLPLPPGAAWGVWSEALDKALGAVAAFGAEALVVSLGVDTFKEDPISFFRLESADFLSMGARIAGVGLPTVFVMEGGYAVDAIGVNVVNTLEGFLGA
jgi:acetoin utilization deacetylase AcuC-like enzyme